MPVRHERVTVSRSAIKALREEYARLDHTDNPVVKTINQADAVPSLETIPDTFKEIIREYDLDTPIANDPLALQPVWNRLVRLAKIVGYDHRHVPKTIRGLAQMERLLLTRRLFREREVIRKSSIPQLNFAQSTAFCKIMLTAMDEQRREVQPLDVQLDLTEEAGSDTEFPWLPEDDFPEGFSEDEVVKATEGSRAYLDPANVDTEWKSSESAKPIEDETPDLDGRDFDREVQVGKKVTYNMSGRAVNALYGCAAFTDANDTQIRDQAVILLADVLEAQACGGGIWIQRRPDGERERVRIYL